MLAIREVEMTTIHVCGETLPGALRDLAEAVYTRTGPSLVPMAISVEDPTDTCKEHGATAGGICITLALGHPGTGRMVALEGLKEDEN